jgi:mRNA interferase MazF
MPNNCKRGTVIEVCLDPSVGSEYMKTRPCLVVQSDVVNKHSRVTIVVPLTSAENAKQGPTFVPVKKGDGGLPKDSIVVCNQPRTVDESRLGKVYGQVGPDTMLRVTEALRIVLDL